MRDPAPIAVMNFDGSNDGVNVGPSMRTGLSASAFSFKFNYIHFANTDEFRASILDFRSGGQGFSLATVGSSFRMFKGSTQIGAFDYTIPLNVNYEYGVNTNGTIAALYVDGVFEETKILSQTPNFGSSHGSIGYQANGPVYYTEGVIWDLRLYNSINFTNRTRRYPGFGNQASDWVDEEGSGADGTTVGSPTEIVVSLKKN